MDACHAWASRLLALATLLGPASKQVLQAPPGTASRCHVPAAKLRHTCRSPSSPLPRSWLSFQPPMSAQMSLRGPRPILFLA